MPLACGWDTIDGRTKWSGLEEEITKLREVRELMVQVLRACMEFRLTGMKGP